jgi:hypothetical protein
MEYSRRLLRFIEPVCIECYGCLYGYHLAPTEFYAEVERRVDARTPGYRRLLARGADQLVKSARKGLARLRKIK